MDSACPEKDATEILSDSDHSTKVAPTTLTSTYLFIKHYLLFLKTYNGRLDLSGLKRANTVYIEYLFVLNLF